MEAVLSFSVEFLGPVILADPYRANRAEWPPAPARVFGALVAAACEHDLGADVLCAIEGLEGLAPAITATEAEPTAPHRLSVPAPYRRGPGELALMAEPEVYPTIPVVSYHWPVADQVQAELVGRAVRCLTYLGRGENLVLGDVYDPGQAPAPTLEPDAEAGPDAVWVRVPERGHLAALERDYRRGRACMVMDAPVPYRQVAKTAGPDLAAGPWGELLPLRLGGGHHDARHASRLADGLRRAVLAKLGDGASPEVHGHGPAAPHVAWLALPHVGGAHGDGRVPGLAALLPAGISPGAANQVRWVLAGLREIPFGRERVPVAPVGRPLATLRAETWAGPAKRWATATPLVLEHRVGPDARRAVAQALVRAGYPRPLRVEVDVIPFLRGAEHAAATLPRRAMELPRRHALVEFSEPVRGPVLAGAERYFGLGLFRPLRANG